MMKTRIILSVLAAQSATEDFSYWGKKDSSIWLLIAVGVLMLVIGVVYRSLRRPR